MEMGEMTCSAVQSGFSIPLCHSTSAWAISLPCAPQLRCQPPTAFPGDFFLSGGFGLSGGEEIVAAIAKTMEKGKKSIFLLAEISHKSMLSAVEGFYSHFLT